jgi:hypothetical protein
MARIAAPSGVAAIKGYGVWETAFTSSHHIAGMVDLFAVIMDFPVRA